MKKMYFSWMLVTGWLITGFLPVHPVTDKMTVIHFRHWAGNKELVLFDETYTNSFGEPFMVTKFRYYISGLSVTTVNGSEMKLGDACFLVNEADSISKIIGLPVAAAVQSISFVIGVDSSRNVSGVQTGSLDPANGMFWTWNSGYVFAKLEGESDSSHGPAHSFTWDVGGFRKKESALRKITLVIGNNSRTTGNITINADILKWFDAVHALKISQSPACHQPGKLAMQLADNYSQMFSVAP